MDPIRDQQDTGAGKADTEVISEGSSSVLELSAGRLIRLTDGLNAFFSKDRGSSWEGGPLEDSEGSVEGGIEFGLCRLKSGDVGLLYGRKEEAPSLGPVRTSYFRTSSDEGETWSGEVRLDYRGKDAWAWHDTITVCTSGRIVVPFREVNSPQFTSPTFTSGMGTLDNVPIAVEGHAHKPEMDIGFVMYSDDEGKSWTQSKDPIYIWWEDGFGGMFPCDEPAIAQTRDGRLLMFMRTTLGVLFQSWSEDEGESWSMPEPTTLSSSYSPARLRAVPESGDLICVWNQVSMPEIQRGGRRCRLSSAVSQDDGKTWEHFKTIEVGGLDDSAVQVPPPDEPTFVRSSKEVGEIPKGWGMYSYANLNFAHGKAFLEYEYRVGPTIGEEDRKWFGGPHISWKTQGRKRRVLPIDWFYG